MFNTVESILAHFGIPGMKWGVRKGDKKSSVKDISDDELKKRVNRLNLEKRYADLRPESKNRAVEAVKKILVDVGTRAAKQAMNKKVDQIIEAKIAVKPIKDDK